MHDILVDAQGKGIPHMHICLYDKEVIANKYIGRFLEQIK